MVNIALFEAQLEDLGFTATNWRLAPLAVSSLRKVDKQCDKPKAKNLDTNNSYSCHVMCKKKSYAGPHDSFIEKHCIQKFVSL